MNKLIPNEELLDKMRELVNEFGYEQFARCVQVVAYENPPKPKRVYTAKHYERIGRRADIEKLLEDYPYLTEEWFALYFKCSRSLIHSDFVFLREVEADAALAQHWEHLKQSLAEKQPDRKSKAELV